MAANSFERLELIRCKVVYISSCPKNDWPYHYSFITNWKCDTVETNLSNLSTFGESLEQTTVELGELSLSLFQPYIYYSMASDIVSIEDSLSLYMSDCQNKINENLFEYTVVTRDSSNIKCEIADVLGVFFVDSSRLNSYSGAGRATLVSLITCSEGTKIEFIEKKEVPLDDGASN